jgi:hypothetical protein
VVVIVCLLLFVVACWWLFVVVVYDCLLFVGGGGVGVGVGVVGHTLRLGLETEGSSVAGGAKPRERRHAPKNTTGWRHRWPQTMGITSSPRSSGL